MKSKTRVVSHLKDVKGLTIVEALVALGLISVIALSTTTYFAQVSKHGSRRQESCRLYNLSFLNRIRSYGSTSSIYNFTPMPGQTLVSSSTPPFASPQEVISTYRWPSEPILSSGVNPMLNNHLLIDGNMNLLQSLFNNVSGICTGFVSLSSLSIQATSMRIAPPKQLNATPAGMLVQIVPYKIDTGEVIDSCSGPDVPTPLYVAPRGNYLKDTNSPINVNSPFEALSAEDVKLTRPSNVRTNVGFAVRAKTAFTEEDGTSDMCITEQRFQYETDIDAPPVPTILSSTMTSADLVDCHAHSNNTFSLDVGYNTGRVEPGTVLLCQDQSIKPEDPVPSAVAGVPTRSNVQCLTGNSASGAAPPGPQVAFYYPATPGSYFPPAGNGGFDYVSHSTSYGIRRWVPCYSLQLCGRNPVRVDNTSTSSPTATTISYHLEYTNLPSDCRIVVKTAGIDTGANSSPELASPSMGSNNPVLFTGPANSWDVPRPRCRVFCGDFLTGYFTCGSC